MNNCKVCDKQIDDQRYHLGYTECVECSDTEKYSAHTVYPHKTGGYVQPEPRQLPTISNGWIDEVLVVVKWPRVS